MSLRKTSRQRQRPTLNVSVYRVRYLTTKAGSHEAHEAAKPQSRGNAEAFISVQQSDRRVIHLRRSLAGVAPPRLWLIDFVFFEFFVNFVAECV
jgi:hypothetical protein